MKDKILIRRDTRAEAEFLKAIDDTIQRGNELIELFSSTQDFARIDTMQDFVSLLTDPLQYYDDILTANISHDNRLQVNMNTLASLYNIPRIDYLTGLGLTVEQASKCISCGGGTQVLPKNKVLSFNQYTAYTEFLSWKAGELCRNESAIKNHSDSFNVYASTRVQIETYNHYMNLTETLNKAIEFHKLSQSKIDDLAKMFGLLILNNRLIINDISLSEQFKYLN